METLTLKNDKGGRRCRSVWTGTGWWFSRSLGLGSFRSLGSSSTSCAGR